MHVFGQWKEIGVPEENSHIQGECIQTPPIGVWLYHRNQHATLCMLDDMKIKIEDNFVLWQYENVFCYTVKFTN